MRIKTRLKEEYQMICGTPHLVFEWAKIGADLYIVYLPKIFRKEPGGSVATLNGKKMMKMIADVRREIKGLGAESTPTTSKGDNGKN